MAQPYVGEIRLGGWNFAPNGWAFCHGQLLSIAENDVLFQLIGTTYGGDGENTFAVPDLRGRVPVHMGTGPDGTTHQIGGMAGVEEVTLSVQQIPSHFHPLVVSDGPGTHDLPRGGVLATPPGVRAYAAGETPNTALSPATLGPAGGSQPHTNFMPYLCINYVISLYGIFPSQ
ncbi:phage tail protein [Nocardioides daphniae]|uniref:Phage tail protein n=1 Tax=Nocardioides daphniae TaxID=402297 RepID=A0A4V1CWD2_9ACTN|nr:tail fiber protein [Nocardioides daphniae]QCC76857.1 phage tail protein [Nocardioides daphniae]GGD17123.1 tail Collar domain-containing protein [Nocardioides daphniae]